jgi:hypothetical protein
MMFSRPVVMRAMRIAFSFASVPELQKKAFVRDSGATETNFSAACARVSGINKIRIEEHFAGLLFDCLHHMRVTMARSGKPRGRHKDRDNVRHHW